MISPVVTATRTIYPAPTVWPVPAHGPPLATGPPGVATDAARVG
jgi:hypothetical protein